MISVTTMSLGSGLLLGSLITVGILVVIVGVIALIARAVFRRGRIKH